MLNLLPRGCLYSWARENERLLALCAPSAKPVHVFFDFLIHACFEVVYMDSMHAYLEFVDALWIVNMVEYVWYVIWEEFQEVLIMVSSSVCIDIRISYSGLP